MPIPPCDSLLKSHYNHTNRPTMTSNLLSLFASIAVSIVSCVFLWHAFQKAPPGQRHQIFLAAVGVVSVALLVAVLSGLSII
jgi:hypothetical protein